MRKPKLKNRVYDAQYDFPDDDRCRCDVCGRFISQEEFSNGDIDIDFTPDTHFTVEKLEYTHKKCLSDE